MKIKPVMLTSTLVILVLLLPAIIYHQLREFRTTLALTSSAGESLIDSLRMYGIKAQVAVD